MLILFSLIVMRMSGAFLMNPIFGQSRIPRRARAAMVLVFSLMLYMGKGGVLLHEPETLLEYGVMLVKEIAMGYALGFGMELTTFTVRYATSIIDFSMGLSMAQIYDPEFSSQMTVSTGLFNAFFSLLFFAVNGHMRLIALFFRTAELIPFGQVRLNPALGEAMAEIFIQSLMMGMQLAFPVIAIELVTESAVGILMRMIPQINVFSVNFQIKIIVGLLMLFILFSPLADKIEVIIEMVFQAMEQLIMLMRPI